MTAMTDYLSGLIIFLCEAEIHVHGNKGLVSFPPHAKHQRRLLLGNQ